MDEAAIVESVRSDGSRIDARGNRSELIDAVGRLLAGGGAFTLSALADEARVSRATAYRNFSEPAEAIDAYVEAFLVEFEADVASNASSDPLQRLVDLCGAWGRLVEERSLALIHVRSTEGFLARVRRGDPAIAWIHGLVRAAIVDVIDDRAAADGDPDFDPDYGVFLWNILLDPRDLLDLAEHRNEKVTAAAARLTDEFIGLLPIARPVGLEADAAHASAKNARVASSSGR